MRQEVEDMLFMGFYGVDSRHASHFLCFCIKHALRASQFLIVLIELNFLFCVLQLLLLPFVHLECC